MSNTAVRYVIYFTNHITEERLKVRRTDLAEHSCLKFLDIEALLNQQHSPLFEGFADAVTTCRNPDCKYIKQ